MAAGPKESIAENHTTAVTGFDLDALHQRSPLDAQVRATLTLVPAHVWYASPNGALTFVNGRTADYLGLPEDHPLRFGTNTGADWDSHIVFLHPDDREQTRRIISYDGGYQQYMIAPVEALVPIPDGLSDVEAAPLLDAGITTYNALRNSGAMPGYLVAV